MALNRISKNMIDQDFVKQVNDTTAQLAQIAINVKVFGAKGDGITDDSQAVLNAVNHAEQLGYGYIYIPSNQIKINSAIDCKGFDVVGVNTVINGKLKNVGKFVNVIINEQDVSDVQLDAHYIPSAVTPKIVFKASTKPRYYVITKKASGKGYLFYDLERGITTTNTDRDYGAPADLLRVVGVRNLLTAYVYKHQYKNINGTWEKWSLTLNGRSLYFWRNSSRNMNDYIEYDVQVPANGKLTMAFHMTGSSSTQAEVSVDGELMETINLSNSPNAMLIKEYNLKPGNRTLRVTCNQDGGWLYVAGINFYELQNADVEREFDEFAYNRDSNDYIHNNGALDYAFVEDSTNKYFGSYHGGERLLSESVVLDNQVIDLEVNTLAVGNNIQFHQLTNMIDKLSANTLMKFVGDGVFDFSAILEGDVDVSTAYTHMTTTSDKFDEIIYPKFIKIEGNEEEIYLGRTNKIVQRNSITNQMITSIFTLFNKENNFTGGAFIRPSPGVYNKTYYGKVVRSLENLNSLRFQTIRIFE